MIVRNTLITQKTRIW